MTKSYKLFTINPGSTSTKIALFENERKVFAANVTHDAETLKTFKEISDQFAYRKETILDVLRENGISLEGTDAFVGRCGGMASLTGGTYEINDLMLEHTRKGMFVRHPANLGNQLADDFAKTYGGKSFIVNPPDTDEFDLIARVSGLADAPRECKTHALNQKEVGIRFGQRIGKRYEDLNLVIAHIGGGVSVTAHRKGMMVDSTDIVNGDGPMAPTRAGAIPGTAVVKMCFSGKYSEKDMYGLFTKNGGMVDHLGTAEVLEVVERIEKGDQYAKLIYDGMIYQICKSIGAYAVVLKGQVDAILLTGGISRDAYLVDQIKDRTGFLAPIHVYAGEFEMEALAAGALRVLTGREQAKTYTGEPVWKGFEK